MTSSQSQAFRRELYDRLHHLTRSFADQGILVRRTELLAATLAFCTEHLRLIVEDERRLDGCG